MFVNLGKNALFISLFLCCFNVTSEELGESLPCDKLKDVSVISMIAKPEAHDKTCIRVRGVLFLDDKSGRLFLSKESLSNNVLSNSIRIIMDSESIEKIRELDGSYVTIIGVFKNNAIASILDIGL